MSTLPGYDAWLTTEPSDERDARVEPVQFCNLCGYSVEECAHLGCNMAELRTALAMCSAAFARICEQTTDDDAAKIAFACARQIDGLLNGSTRHDGA